VGAALNLLVDSSTLIWMSAVPAMLSDRARAALEAADNTIFVSAASAWEIATKHRLGGLDHAGPLLESWTTGFADAGYVLLGINDRHALRAGNYDVSHADPFDRIIAAQAELERMVLVASDRAFDLFPVQRLW
jgi:PIN domain nuclease of toxin-antitoxin system